MSRRRDEPALASNVLPPAPRVARTIAEAYGLELVTMSPVSGGWDLDAAVWAGVDDRGRSWGVKATRRDVSFGLAVAASLASAGVDGIVAPLPTLAGALHARIGDVRVVVMPWIEGVDAVEVGIDRVDWHRLGATLRAVHDHPAPATARPRRRGVRRTPRSPGALLAEVDDRVAALGGPDAAAICERWQEARGRIEPLVRAERALKRGREPAERVTLHGDPHLGNVVLDADGRPWFIDFDESAVAPREVDLMLVELGVLFSLPIGEEHRRRFREGYGLDAAVDARRIVRFGCVRAVEDVASVFLHALDDSAPAGVDPLVVLDGMLGEHGLVTLVERELGRLGAMADAAEQRE